MGAMIEDHVGCQNHCSQTSISLLKYQNIQNFVSKMNSQRSSRPGHTIHNHSQQIHTPAPYTNT